MQIKNLMTPKLFREILDENNLSQTEVAKDLGVHRQQVWNWYHGKMKRINMGWQRVLVEYFKNKSTEK